MVTSFLESSHRHPPHPQFRQSRVRAAFRLAQGGEIVHGDRRRAYREQDPPSRGIWLVPGLA